jgi:hypothetical protein
VLDQLKYLEMIVYIEQKQVWFPAGRRHNMLHVPPCFVFGEDKREAGVEGWNLAEEE